MKSLQETVSNTQWVLANYTRLRDVFPAARTLMTQQDMLRIGFGMKVAGVDWRTETELSQVMVLCYHLGMYNQEPVNNQCVYIKRSQATMPPPKFFHMSAEQIQVNRILRAEPTAEVQDLAMELISSIMYPPK